MRFLHILALTGAAMAQAEQPGMMDRLSAFVSNFTIGSDALQKVQSLSKKRVLVTYGVDIDAVAGWLGSVSLTSLTLSMT
jgi:hypothetical protein